MELDGISVLKVFPRDSSVSVLVIVHEKLFDIIDVGFGVNPKSVEDALQTLDEFFKVESAVSVMVISVEDFVDLNLNVPGDDDPLVGIVEVQGNHVGKVIPA